ncbi:MAG: ribose-phosphate pyrophosphokinase [Lachnospiraceae bacterium]|nr:ribose-phosphate pyrophosphokinase [Lachnospiraceae bacterium]
MPDFQKLEEALPVAPLGIIAMKSAEKLGKTVNDHLVEFRSKLHAMRTDDPAFKGYTENNYLINAACPRFGSGEGKGEILESVHGRDLFIITDVCNPSVTYKMYGFENHMSPDDHYQDLKRVVAAANINAKRINVIMPFLYEGRQHKRNTRESLDAATMFAELYDMGISNFITFDAHDPRISNAAPNGGFDNFMAPYQFLKALMKNFDDLTVDKEHLVVISPDEGALDRAVYFAGVLGADTGMFYKRRDFSRIVNGSNPIVAHEFLGSGIEGKDAIIIDDMISSGNSIIDTAAKIKEKGAKRVFLCTTFGLFTNGLELFDKAYEQGSFDRVITTNLTWQPEELKTREWFLEADMSKFLATIIDFINHDASLSGVTMPTEKIHEIVKLYNQREDSAYQKAMIENEGMTK